MPLNYDFDKIRREISGGLGFKQQGPDTPYTPAEYQQRELEKLHGASCTTGIDLIVQEQEHIQRLQLEQAPATYFHKAQATKGDFNLNIEPGMMVPVEGTWSQIGVTTTPISIDSMKKMWDDVRGPKTLLQDLRDSVGKWLEDALQFSRKKVWVS